MDRVRSAVSFMIVGRRPRIKGSASHVALVALALCGCEAFSTLGPGGCDPDHLCRDPARPRCDVETLRCLPAAPGIPDGGTLDGAVPCRAHEDCPSSICDEFGVVLAHPGFCVPREHTATVSSRQDLLAELRDALGIRIKPGIYQGGWDIGRNVILVGSRAVNGDARAQAMPAVAMGGPSGWVIHVGQKAQVVLDGIAVQGGSGMNGHGVLCDGTDSQLFLRRVEVTGNDGLGVWSRSPLFVDQSVIGTMDADRGNLGGGILAEARVTVQNSFIARNGTGYSQVGGIAVSTAHPEVPEIRHLTQLTLVGNYKKGEGNAIHCNTAATSVWQSLFWDNQTITKAMIAGGCDLHMIAADDPSYVTSDGQEFSMDITPQFRGEHDLHLMATSPAVDRMPMDGAAPTLDHDIDGDPRPLGKTRDYGADEFFSGS